MNNILWIDICLNIYTFTFLFGFIIESFFKDKSYIEFVLINLFSIFRVSLFWTLISLYEVSSIIFPLILFYSFEWYVILSNINKFWYSEKFLI